MTPSPAHCTSNSPVRMTAPEHAQIQAKAALKGLTVPEYIRTCMGFGYPA